MKSKNKTSREIPVQENIRNSVENIWESSSVGQWLSAAVQRQMAHVDQAEKVLQLAVG